MVLPSSPRYGAQIDWVGIHSAEGARTIGSLFDFFNRGQHASSHAAADGYQLSGDWVPDERAAWTLLNGNPRSLNLELCGFAHWTREQWLSEGWVDGVWNPRQMIRHAAKWTRQKCDRHNVPRRLLTPDQVANNERGIIDHFRYTIGKKDGNHTDVGKNYPFDVFMSDVEAAGSGPAPIEDEQEDDTVDEEKIALPASMKTTAVRVWLDPRKACALTLKAVKGQTIFFVGSYHWGPGKTGMAGDPLAGGTKPPIRVEVDTAYAWTAPKGTVYADILYSTAVEGGELIKYV